VLSSDRTVVGAGLGTDGDQGHRVTRFDGQSFSDDEAEARNHGFLLRTPHTGLSEVDAISKPRPKIRRAKSATIDQLAFAGTLQTVVGRSYRGLGAELALMNCCDGDYPT